MDDSGSQQSYIAPILQLPAEILCSITDLLEQSSLKELHSIGNPILLAKLKARLPDRTFRYFPTSPCPLGQIVEMISETTGANRLICSTELYGGLPSPSGFLSMSAKVTANMREMHLMGAWATRLYPADATQEVIQKKFANLQKLVLRAGDLHSIVYPTHLTSLTMELLRTANFNLSQLHGLVNLRVLRMPYVHILHYHPEYMSVSSLVVLELLASCEFQPPEPTLPQVAHFFHLLPRCLEHFNHREVPSVGSTCSWWSSLRSCVLVDGSPYSFPPNLTALTVMGEIQDVPNFFASLPKTLLSLDLDQSNNGWQYSAPLPDSLTRLSMNCGSLPQILQQEVEFEEEGKGASWWKLPRSLTELRNHVLPTPESILTLLPPHICLFVNSPARRPAYDAQELLGFRDVHVRLSPGIRAHLVRESQIIAPHRASDIESALRGREWVNFAFAIEIDAPVVLELILSLLHDSEDLIYTDEIIDLVIEQRAMNVARWFTNFKPSSGSPNFQSKGLMRRSFFSIASAPQTKPDGHTPPLNDSKSVHPIYHILSMPGISQEELTCYCQMVIKQQRFNSTPEDFFAKTFFDLSPRKKIDYTPFVIAYHNQTYRFGSKVDYSALLPLLFQKGQTLAIQWILDHLSNKDLLGISVPICLPDVVMGCQESREPREVLAAVALICGASWIPSPVGLKNDLFRPSDDVHHTSKSNPLKPSKRKPFRVRFSMRSSEYPSNICEDPQVMYDVLDALTNVISCSVGPDWPSNAARELLEFCLPLCKLGSLSSSIEWFSQHTLIQDVRYGPTGATLVHFAQMQGDTALLERFLDDPVCLFRIPDQQGLAPFADVKTLAKHQLAKEWAWKLEKIQNPKLNVPSDSVPPDALIQLEQRVLARLELEEAIEQAFAQDEPLDNFPKQLLRTAFQYRPLTAPERYTRVYNVGTFVQQVSAITSQHPYLDISFEQLRWKNIKNPPTFLD